MLVSVPSSANPFSHFHFTLSEDAIQCSLLFPAQVGLLCEFLHIYVEHDRHKSAIADSAEKEQK